MSRLHSNMFFQILLGFRQAIKSKIIFFLALNLSIFWMFHDKHIWLQKSIIKEDWELGWLNNELKLF